MELHFASSSSTKASVSSLIRSASAGLRLLLLPLLAAACVCPLPPTEAAVAIDIRPYPAGAAGQQTGCLLAEYGDKQLAFGEVWPVPPEYGQCVTLGCDDARAYTSALPRRRENDGANESFVVRHTGCGTVLAQKPCRIVAEPHLPHPACCPKIVCHASTADTDETGRPEANSVYDQDGGRVRMDN